MLLVAPTEPPQLKKLGKVSSVPESYGLDYMFITHNSLISGVQRKQFPGDFTSSLNDGRLGKEIVQMGPLGDRDWETLPSFLS